MIPSSEFIRVFFQFLGYCLGRHITLFLGAFVYLKYALRVAVGCGLPLGCHVPVEVGLVPASFLLRILANSLRFGK